MTATVKATPLVRALTYLYPMALPFFGFSLYNVGERGLGRPDWIVGAAIVVVGGSWALVRGVGLRRSPAYVFVALFALTGLLSGIGLWNASTDQVIDFLTKAGQLVLVTAVFFAMSLLPLVQRELGGILRAWLLIACLVALYGLYQLVARPFDLPFGYLGMTNPSIAQAQTGRTLVGYMQFSSVFSEPSYLASFLSGPFILAAVLAFSRANQPPAARSSYINWLVVAILGLTILLAGSQGSYASLLMTLAFAFVFGILNRWAVLRLLALAGLLFLVTGLALHALGIGFLEATVQRFVGLMMNIQDPANTAAVTSFANRYARTVAALQIWAEHPVLGVGLGGMPYYTEVHPWANNGWAQVLVDQGLLGAAVLALIPLTLYSRLAALRRSAAVPPVWRAVATGLMLVLVFDVVDEMFTLNWTHSQRWFTLTMANCVYLGLRSYGREAAGSPPGRSPLPGSASMTLTEAGVAAAGGQPRQS